MEQKNNRKNIRVFDNANTIAGVPKIILLLSSVLPLLMMMQGIIILGAMILFANTWVLVRIYKDDERALSVWVYALLHRETYWEAGYKTNKDLIIIDKN